MHRKDPTEDPSERTLQRRMQTLTAFLTHLYKRKSLGEALKEMAHDIKLAELMHDASIETLKEVGLITSKPTFDEIFKWFHKMRIPESDWVYTSQVFQVEEITLYQLRKKKKELGSQLLSYTCDQNQDENIRFSLWDYLKWDLDRHPVSSNKIIIKIAFDGGYLTRSRKQVVEIATWERIDNNLYPHKSPRNAHLFFMSLSKESHKLFDSETNGIIKDINNVIAKPNIGSYLIDLRLSADMVALCFLLGLKKVYKPQAKYCCAWCYIKREDMAQFSHSSWELRTHAKQIEISQKIRNKSKPSPDEAQGTKQFPRLIIPWEHIYPCTLHLVMGVGKKIFSNLMSTLVYQTQDQQIEAIKIGRMSKGFICEFLRKNSVACSEKLTKAELLELAYTRINLIRPTENLDKKAPDPISNQLMECFSELNIKLWTPSDGKKVELMTCFQKSRFNRSDTLRLLTNYQMFIDAVEKNVNQIVVPNLIKIMEQTLDFLSAACSDLERQKIPFLNAADWKSKARSWGKMVAEMWGADGITPYIHCLIYHVGDYLFATRNLEKYAGYGIEGKIQQNKNRYNQTNHSGGEQKSVNSTVSYSLLTNDLISHTLDIPGTDYKEKREVSWCELTLTRKEWLQQIGDSTNTAREEQPAIHVGTH
jgi:hypothetical protein